MNAEVDITSYPSFCVEGEGLHILSDNGIELLAADAALRPGHNCCALCCSKPKAPAPPLRPCPDCGQVLHCDRDCLREDVHKRGACAAYKAALAIKAAQPRLSASQLEKHIASIKLTSKTVMAAGTEGWRAFLKRVSIRRPKKKKRIEDEVRQVEETEVLAAALATTTSKYYTGPATIIFACKGATGLLRASLINTILYPLVICVVGSTVTQMLEYMRAWLVLGDLTIPTDYKRGDMKRQGVILQFVSPDIPDTLHKTVQRLSARVHATFYKGTHAELQEAIRLSGKSIMWTHPPLKHHTYSFFKKADEWPTELLALPRIVASFQADPVQTLRDSRSVKRLFNEWCEALRAQRGKHKVRIAFINVTHTQTDAASADASLAAHGWVPYKDPWGQTHMVNPWASLEVKQDSNFANNILRDNKWLSLYTLTKVVDGAPAPAPVPADAPATQAQAPQAPAARANTWGLRIKSIRIGLNRQARKIGASMFGNTNQQQIPTVTRPSWSARLKRFVSSKVPKFNLSVRRPIEKQVAYLTSGVVGALTSVYEGVFRRGPKKGKKVTTQLGKRGREGSHLERRTEQGDDMV